MKVLKLGFALLLLLGLAAAATFYLQPLWVSDQAIRMHLRAQNVQSRYIDVDGYTIHYFEALPPTRLHAIDDGTPIVLIHGLGARGEDWAAMIPTLAANGFHVYAPDLLGYGRSSRPDIDYSIAQQAKIVSDFMRQIHLDHAHVAGWSMGGWVALKLTLDHPEVVNRLIVYDSAGVYFPATFDASLFSPVDSPGLVKLTGMLTPHPRPLPQFIAKAALRKLQANAWVIQRSVHAMESGKDLLDFRLHAITNPTLIVWGSNDVLIPPAAGEQMHRTIPGSSLLLIEGCGHLAPAECSKPVLKGTLEFLEAHPPPLGGESTLPGDMK